MDFFEFVYTWIDWFKNVHTKGSVFFNQSFTNFKNMFLDLNSLTFLCIILFWDERDIKCEKHTYLSLFLIDVDNRRIMDVILGGKGVKF